MFYESVLLFGQSVLIFSLDNGDVVVYPWLQPETTKPAIFLSLG